MQQNQIQLLKPKTAVEKKTRTVVDTLIVTPELLSKWAHPPFQRPLRENEKVRKLAEQLKQDGGVIPGIITLGVLDGMTYIIDGQHRIYSFLQSGLKEGYVDIRKHFFESMADMGDEFVMLNSQLVRMRPDDILRGLEGSTPRMAELRTLCPFVGYDMIRRNDSRAPIVSMAALLRQWGGSAMETPGNYANGMSTTSLAAALSGDDINNLSTFLTMGMEAWGRDQEHYRMWGGLNMTLCMWLYRNTVLQQYSPKVQKISKDLFKKCMMGLAADQSYGDWLVGRKLGDRDRSPAFNRIKGIFASRIYMETGKRPILPAPAWLSDKHAV